MKVQCPTCRREVVPDDVNVARDTAFCRACNEVFPLSDLVSGDDLEGVDLANPPSGVAVMPTPRGFVISATARSGTGVFFVIFAIFWNSLVSVFVAVTVANFIKNGFSKSAFDNAPFPGFEFLFLTPFVLVGVGMAAAALATLLGKVIVSVDGSDGRVFIGVGPVGWTRRFDWHKVTSVREAKSTWTQNDRHVPLILIDGETPLKFGSLLNEQRRRYVAAALRHLLASQRRAGAP